MVAPLHCRGCAFRGNSIIARHGRVVHTSCLTRMHLFTKGGRCAVESGGKYFKLLCPEATPSDTNSRLKDTLNDG